MESLTDKTFFDEKPDRLPEVEGLPELNDRVIGGEY